MRARSLPTAVVAAAILTCPTFAPSQLLHPADTAAVSEDPLSRRWPNGVVPIEVDPTGAFTAADLTSRNAWRAATGGAVRFVTRAAGETPYIHITLGPRNSTAELRGLREADGQLIEGRRRAWIRPTSPWNVNHELGHVLGLWHQHRHPDSARCVTPVLEIEAQLHPSAFIGPYDSHSVMHYMRNAVEFTRWDPACVGTTGPDGPTDFDAHYIKKLYGVNGEYLHDTSWCAGRERQVYLGDFNGDGLDDLLCHARAAEGVTDAGARAVIFAQANPADVYGGPRWQSAAHAFCRLRHRRLYVGRFDNDDRDDLLCHDIRDGRRFVDHADPTGRLDGTDVRHDPFCVGSGRTLLLGDFDRDGLDDLMCVVNGGGAITIDHSANGYGAVDWRGDTRWCLAGAAQFVVGDFDGDGRDDLACHDLGDGDRWLAYADAAGTFPSSQWNSPTGAGTRVKPFCWGRARRLYAGDVDGDGRDDLICHNRRTGSVAVDFATSADRNEGSRLWKANIFRELSFCNAQDARLFVGRLPKNPAGPQPASLFCQNAATGHQAARYALD